MDYPSRWWMVSVSCIITAGVLCTAYLALWIGITVVNLRLHRLAHKYGIPSEAVPDQLLPDGKFLTPSIFTSDELAYMGYHQNVLFDLLDTGRLFLTVSLWLTKLAFATSLLATSDCMGRFQKWVLYASSVVVLLSLGVALWISSSPFPWENEAFTPDDIMILRVWDGVISDYYENLWQEYTLTGINIATDLLLASVGCYIVYSLASAKKLLVLVVMFSIMIATAVSRLVLVINLFRLATYTPIISDPQTQPSRNRASLVTASQVMSEFEVLVSAIVSCLPAIRAWMRTMASTELVEPYKFET